MGIDRRLLTLSVSVVAALTLAPLAVSDYYISVLLDLLMWIALTESWIILSGYTGYISLGHSAFFGLGAYYFHFQQVFVKRYGGVMSINVPEGQLHITATWKDDNLWIENYDPKTNTCHFNEYSRGNLLQGKVTIKNCNPLLRTQEITAPSISPPQQ